VQLWSVKSNFNCDYARRQACLSSDIFKNFIKVKKNYVKIMTITKNSDTLIFIFDDF
jgi:hypothetical protein